MSSRRDMWMRYIEPCFIFALLENSQRIRQILNECPVHASMFVPHRWTIGNLPPLYHIFTCLSLGGITRIRPSAPKCQESALGTMAMCSYVSLWFVIQFFKRLFFFLVLLLFLLFGMFYLFTILCWYYIVIQCCFEY